MSFWLVCNPSEPLFGKEGYGEILWRIDLFKKSPSIPLCQRGKMQGKIPDSPRRVRPSADKRNDTGSVYENILQSIFKSLCADKSESSLITVVLWRRGRDSNPG